MRSMREQPEYVFIVHFLNTVNIFVLFVHPMIIINTYIDHREHYRAILFGKPMFDL